MKDKKIKGYLYSTAAVIAIPTIILGGVRLNKKVSVRAAPPLNKQPIRREISNTQTRELPKTLKNEPLELGRRLEPETTGEIGDDDLKEFISEDYTIKDIDLGQNKINNMINDNTERMRKEQEAKDKIKEAKITALQEKIEQDLARRNELIQKRKEERDRLITESNRRYRENIQRMSKTNHKYDSSDLFVIQEALKSSPDTELSRKINSMMPSYIGKPYVWGGDDRTTRGTGYDCSGFTLSVMNQLGYTKLPRVSADQFKTGEPIAVQNLQPGDLVFFDTKNTPGSENTQISHVGLYIGRGLMVHASSGSNRIRTEQVFSNYFAPRYKGARRYIQ